MKSQLSMHSHTDIVMPAICLTSVNASIVILLCCQVCSGSEKRIICAKWLISIDWMNYRIWGLTTVFSNLTPWHTFLTVEHKKLIEMNISRNNNGDGKMYYSHFKSLYGMHFVSYEWIGKSVSLRSTKIKTT